MRASKWGEELQRDRENRRRAIADRKIEWKNRGQFHQDTHAKLQKEIIEKSRAARENGEVFVPAECKVLLVIRIKGINAIPPKERKILRLLRLRQINNAVFVKRNEAVQNLLRRVEPWISFG